MPLVEITGLGESGCMTTLDQAVKIKALKAREILDSRGFPTVEVELTAEAGGKEVIERAAVPSGASTGEGEALELRDGDKKRFLGKGVLKAIANIREKIAPAVLGREYVRLALFDDFLRSLDGTENKSALGANALLGVSMAFARAQSRLAGKNVYEGIAAISGTSGVTLPVPLMNVLNGGKHADNQLNIQEFMIVPAGFSTFSDALRAGTEVFHHLKKLLHAKGVSTAVGDEGGFAPVFEGELAHEQALAALMEAITDAGYKPGKDIWLALDCAASEFAESLGPKGEGHYAYQFEGRRMSSQELVALYVRWCEKYPIISIEDALAEHDWVGFKDLTAKLGSKVQLVGDDLFVTNPKFLKKGIDGKVANAILIKLNQIGTVTETLETIKMASNARYRSIASHRSGETEDTFIADLAVGTDCGQIKTGSASRTDRTAKYNQLLRIEERLGNRAKFAGVSAFQR